VAALLLQVGRGEVDQDALGRQGQAHGGQRGAHPLARLADRLVRQADDQEGGQAAADLHLHLDRHGLDVAEGEAADAGEGHPA